MEAERSYRGGELGELARLFLKLAFVAFAGPAAHVAMMRDEVVTRRGWLSDQKFLDLVGTTNLIPGPNSTELAIHIGRLRAGWRGLALARACFIVPVAQILCALAALYDRYGTTPEAQSLLYGVIPVILAVIAQALYGLLRAAVKGPLTAGLGAAALVLYVATGIGEIPLLAAGALVVIAVDSSRRGREGSRLYSAGLPLAAPSLGLLPLAAPASIGGLFLSFFKIGSALFGSGYVLLAFLRSEFVGTGLLTEGQLLDAVAIGQFTPGPVFTTATFIGYLLGVMPGAAVATVGIFLPAFIFVAITDPIILRLRDSPATASLLDGLNGKPGS